MTLDDIKTVYASLKECKPNVEEFSWGPSFELAEKRRKAALKILKKEIKNRERGF